MKRKLPHIYEYWLIAGISAIASSFLFGCISSRHAAVTDLPGDKVAFENDTAATTPPTAAAPAEEKSGVSVRGTRQSFSGGIAHQAQPRASPGGLQLFSKRGR